MPYYSGHSGASFLAKQLNHSILATPSAPLHCQHNTSIFGRTQGIIDLISLWPLLANYLDLTLYIPSASDLLQFHHTFTLATTRAFLILSCCLPLCWKYTLLALNSSPWSRQQLAITGYYFLPTVRLKKYDLLILKSLRLSKQQVVTSFPHIMICLLIRKLL